MNGDPYQALPALYDLEHDPFDDDLPFYEELASAGHTPVLEIGCGTGRIVRHLGALGYETAGIDRSAAMLARARERSGELGERVRYHEADIAAEPVAGKFGLVIFALDTFGHLLTLDEQLAALRNVRRAMKSRGWLVLDCSAPDPGTWVREDSLMIHAWTRELSDRTVQKHYARIVDEMNQIQHLRLWYEWWGGDGAVHRVSTELRLRYFYPAELRLLLEREGFALEHWYGDFDLSPLTEESSRVLAVARLSGRPGRERHE